MQSAVPPVSAARALPALDDAATASVTAAAAASHASAPQNDRQPTLVVSGLERIGATEENMRRTLERGWIRRVAHEGRLFAPAER